MAKNKATRGRKGREGGMGLIELMIALTVLVVGMLSLMTLITTAIRTNNRNRIDTGGTLIAQMVMERIAAQPLDQLARVRIVEHVERLLFENDLRAPQDIARQAVRRVVRDRAEIFCQSFRKNARARRSAQAVRREGFEFRVVLRVGIAA